MSKPTEADGSSEGEVAGAMPDGAFRYRREIFWGDTDTAHIVYTGRFLDFAVEAVEAWLRATIGVDWYAMNLDHGVGCPFVHAELDFVSPLTPRDFVEVAVAVTRVGVSSVGFRIAGYANGTRLSFTGALVSVFIDNQTMQKIPIPEQWRGAIEAYRAAQGEMAPAG